MEWERKKITINAIFICGSFFFFFFLKLFMVALWLSFGLCKTGFIKLNGIKILGTLPLLQKPRALQSAPPLLL